MWSAEASRSRSRTDGRRTHRRQTIPGAIRTAWITSPSEELIITLIDTVSKNGNLLLNIGPKADGTISETRTENPHRTREMDEGQPGGDRQRKALEDLPGGEREHRGRLLPGKGRDLYTASDYRFTCADGAIYAICLKCPADGIFHIKSFAAPRAGSAVGQYTAPFHGIIHDVRILGCDTAPAWHADTEGLHVAAPGLSGEFPVVIKIM